MPDTGLTYMVLFLKDGILFKGKNKVVWRSLQNEDKKSRKKGIEGLIRRTVYRDPKDKGFRGQYVTACLYDNETGDLLNKWVNGTKVL